MNTTQWNAWIRNAEHLLGRPCMSDNPQPEHTIIPGVPMANQQHARDIHDAQKLGYRCPLCNCLYDHLPSCNIYISEPELLLEHLAATGGGTLTEERITEIAEGMFSADDAELLNLELNLMQTLQETEVSPTIEEECRKELEKGRKCGWTNWRQ